MAWYRPACVHVGMVGAAVGQDGARGSRGTRLGVIALVLAALLGSPAYAAGPDADVVWTVERQERMAEWGARTERARALFDARRAWFAGSGSLEAAFADYVGAELNRPAALRGRLALLDERAIARARERSVPAPELGAPKRIERWEARRAEATAAEEAADAGERRLLVSVLARLTDHPELSADALRSLRAPLLARVEAADALPDEASEEEAAAAARDAALAHEQLGRLDGLVRSLLLSEGAGFADLDGELARLERDGALGVARLALLRPFLGAEDGDRVDAALEAWWSGPRLSAALEELQAAKAEAADPPELGEEALAALRAERTASLDRVRAELGAVGEDGHALAGAQRAVLDVERQAAELRLETAEALVGHVQSASDAASEVSRARAEATRAQQEADAAKAAALGARERRAADVLASRARAQSRSAAMWDRAEARGAESSKLIAELAERTAGHAEQIATIRERSALDPQRPDPDAVYRDVRANIGDLRSLPAARGEGLNEARAAAAAAATRVRVDQASIVEARKVAAAVDDATRRTTLEEALADWEAALADEARAVEAVEDAAVRERDAVLLALRAGREHRRALEPYISRAQWDADRSYLLQDFGQELALLGPSVVTLVRERIRAALDIPFALTNWNVLRGLVLGSFWTVVLVVGWLWARGRAEDGAIRLTDRLRRLRPELRIADVRALRDPTARFLRGLTDLALGYLLVGRVGELVPELGFALLIYLQIALYRALLATFDLLVVPIAEVRPGLLVLRRSVFTLARNTVRVAMGYLIARAFVRYVLWDVLGLDITTRLVAALFTAVAFGLLGWGLYLWEPPLRDRIARRSQESKAVAWLAREDDRKLLVIPRSIGILGFFAVALVVDLMYLLARERSGVARLFNAVNRYRLDREDDTEARSPISPELARAIAVEEPDRPVLVERPELLPAVRGALKSWSAGGSRGLVAIVGDRGSGKRTACDQVAALLSESGKPLIRSELGARVVDGPGIRAWLAELCGVVPQPHGDALVEALEALPPTLYVLEDVHRAFTRQVGGFRAMEALLYVLNGTSRHHFWVVSMHRPAWDFFASAGSSVDVGLFGTVIPLKPLSTDQLRALTCGRTEAAGLEVDFSGLYKPNPLGGDPAVELERSIGVFYRLLAEASVGNPRVALHLWTACLEVVDGHVARPYLGSALDMGVVPGLLDNALFVLVALRIQDELDEAELAAVTNIPRGVVRATVRDLLARGLLVRAHDHIHIPDTHLPGITRTLRRRQFLHLGA